VARLPSHDLERLIQRLQQGDDSAWAEFIDMFAPLVLQAARTIERDRDDAADAFVYACERLRERRAARLSAYDVSRPGTFETWLRAVALNLCRDARRRRTGRFRPLLGIRRLPALEQRVFRLRYEVGITFDQALASLLPEFPGLTEQRLAEAETLVAAQLTSRDHWTVLTRRPRLEPIDIEGADRSASEPVATTADPEWLAMAHESRDLLASALHALSPGERLMLSLRYERGVTLARLADMFRLRDVQTADRRVKELLLRLRRALDSRRRESSKTGP